MVFTRESVSGATTVGEATLEVGTDTATNADGAFIRLTETLVIRNSRT